ncbi:MAG TPA: hydrogenase maturation protease [Bryobacteraceae bacterium]|nr:hydrogenase maturation protease [Bryobacteraceae bacterium]
MNEFEWHLLEDKPPVDHVVVSGVELKHGDRVRLRPGRGGDILDLALAGKTAIIESIEQDYEGELHIAVIVEDDPGKDLGTLRQPGHRFFFKPSEVEPLPRILVGGIGNIFLGDDAFGVEVARQLSAEEWPKEVRVFDFGIRSYDLAYALIEGYDTAILVDASARGEAPGTLYVIEPDIDEPEAYGARQAEQVDAHSMNPVTVVRMARSLGHLPKRILLVGCEPATFGPDEGQLGLSEPVQAAVAEAIKLVRSLVAQALKGKQPGGKIDETTA